MQNTDQYKALLVKVQAKLTEFGMACTAWQWMIIHQFDQYRVKFHNWNVSIPYIYLIVSLNAEIPSGRTYVFG